MTSLEQIRLAYGCDETMAWEIYAQTTPFARAVRAIGPMFCHYDRSAAAWRLFGEIVGRPQIMVEGRLAMLRDAARAGKA